MSNFDTGAAKIDQQADIEIAGFEIVDDLGGVFWRKRCNGFDFQNNFAF